MLGKNVPKSLEESMQMFKTMASVMGIADGDTLQTSVSEGTLSLKLKNCMFSEVAGLAKAEGYERCPTCIMGSLTMGALKGLNVADMATLRVEKKKGDCSIPLSSD